MVVTVNDDGNNSERAIKDHLYCLRRAVGGSNMQHGSVSGVYNVRVRLAFEQESELLQRHILDMQ